MVLYCGYTAICPHQKAGAPKAQRQQGGSKVQRRFTDDSVEPRYPEKELESLLKIGIEIRISIGVQLLSRLNDEEGIKQLNTRAQAFRRRP